MQVDYFYKMFLFLGSSTDVVFTFSHGILCSILVLKFKNQNCFLFLICEAVVWFFAVFFFPCKYKLMVLPSLELLCLLQPVTII